MNCEGMKDFSLLLEGKEPISQNLTLESFINSSETQNSEDTVKNFPCLSDDSQGKISLHDYN
jgi:hypothetical protein